MKTPIIIGVGAVKSHSIRDEVPKEPMQLMVEAIKAAIHDAGLSSDRDAQLRKRIDSIDVVATWTWPYEDLPGLIGRNLGATLKHKNTSSHGGNSPGLLLHQTTSRIANGDCQIAVVTGAEALASLAALHKVGVKDPSGWTPRPSRQISLFESMMEKNIMPASIGTRHAVGMPIHVYPMYENALREVRGQSYTDNVIESAKLYAQFAQVAAKNPIAWTYGQRPVSAEALRTTTGKNRMICTPYPLLMNAFNNVNQASACLLTNTDIASELDIPKDLWIYPVAGAGFDDTDEFWLRPNYYSSPAIEKAINTALDLAELEKGDVDVLDVYSCFPIVPKLVCQQFNISITAPSRPITLLGGLTSFGGPGNNYSGHAFVEMVRELRRGDSRHGLVLANGGMLTHAHAIILSNSAPKAFGFPMREAYHAPSETLGAFFDENAEGEAVIETYTVEFDRHGKPSLGHIVGRLLSNQRRFIANQADTYTLTELASTTKEPIGRKGYVHTNEDGRNLFTIKVDANL